MTNEAIKYLIDTEGNPSAVVIPIAFWRQIFPENVDSIESMAEGIEDYCLNRAMDEAVESPLLDREAALAFLEEESD
jgi:hypothetical protein